MREGGRGEVDLHDVVRLLVDLLRVELDRRLREDPLRRRRLGAALDGAVGAVLDAQRGGARGEGDLILGEAEAGGLDRDLQHAPGELGEAVWGV